MQENKQEKSLIKQNISLYLAKKGVTSYEFYKKSGVTRGVLAQNNGISEENIARFLAYAPDVNPAWLITGEGNMLKNDECYTKCEMEVGKDLDIENFPAINQEYQGSPYYNVDFIGGFDSLMNDQTINPDFYINYPPYNKDGVVWVNLTGHSMEPELSNGDIIALKPMNTPIQYLPTKEIYAIVTEEWRTVKRIELSDRDGFIRLLPSNPEYKAQEIPISMITRVYAVLGSIRKFF